MDIEKMVEDGAVLMRDMMGCGLTIGGKTVFCDDKSADFPMTCSCHEYARAVLAIALAAAAETAKQAQFTDDPKHDHWAQACEEVSDRLRTLATQLEAANG